MEIAKLIKAQRTQRSLSQQQLAEMASIDRTHIVKMETGTHLPNLETIQKVLAAMGLKLTVIPIDPDELDKSEAWKDLLEDL